MDLQVVDNRNPAVRPSISKNKAAGPAIVVSKDISTCRV
jgi:hypothetical protein